MKKLISIILAVLLVLTLFGCNASTGSSTPEAAAEAPAEEAAEAPAEEAAEAPAEEEPAAEPEASGDLQSVSVGLTPYAMFVEFAYTKELGIDKEFGIDIELKDYTAIANGFTDVIRGDCDVTSSDITTYISTLANADELSLFAPCGDFHGFFIIGRSDEWVPWDELVEQCGGDIEAACQKRADEYVGKSFCVEPRQLAVISTLMESWGHTLDDVEIINFADDASAAAALEAGEGDLYFGAVPQQMALLRSEEFCATSNHDIVGAAGLSYDIWVCDKDFIENEETHELALRLLAAQMATAYEFDKDPEAMGAVCAEYLGNMLGTTYTVDEWLEMQTKFDQFFNIERAQEKFFNIEGGLSWKEVADYNVATNIKEGVLPEGFEATDNFTLASDLFEELLTRDDLMEIVNSHK